MPRGFEEGDVIDGAYEVLECIGEGGFGEVYRVRQMSMDRDVAMKMLLKDCDEESAGRFRREVHAVRDLSHPHTIEIYDFAELEDGELYYTMEFIEGDTLVERVQNEGAFTPTETRDILCQVLKSLGEAHEHGIVHRDLKPGNVMLAEVYGEENFVKVLDFGIAKAAESSSSEVLDKSFTASEDLVGTLRYMAPEQATDDSIGPYSDLFMVGLMACEMLTGRQIHAGASKPKILNKRLAPNPVEKPDHLDGHPLGDVIDKALRRDGSERYQTAEAMVEDLQEIDENVLQEAELPEVESVDPVEPAMKEVSPSDDFDDSGEVQVGDSDSKPSAETGPPSSEEKPSTGSFSSSLPSPDDLQGDVDDDADAASTSASDAAGSDAGEVRVEASADRANASRPAGDEASSASASGSIPPPDGQSSGQSDVDASGSIPSPGPDDASDDGGDGSVGVPSPDEADASTSGPVPTPDEAASDASGTIPPPTEVEDEPSGESSLPDPTEAPAEESSTPSPTDAADDDPALDSGEAHPDKTTETDETDETDADPPAMPTPEGDSPSESDTTSADDPNTMTSTAGGPSAADGATESEVRGEPPWVVRAPAKLRDAARRALDVVGIDESNRGMVTVASVGALLAVVLGGWFVMGGDSSSTDGPGAGEGEPAAAADESDAETTVRIESNRDGVRIFHDGTDLGETPVEVTVGQKKTAEARFDGNTRTVELTPDTGSVRRVTFDAPASADAGDAADDVDTGDATRDTDTSDADDADTADTFADRDDEDEEDESPPGSREADDRRTGSPDDRSGQSGRASDDQQDDEGKKEDEEEVPVFDY